jgi:hypothetical protein
MGRVISEVEVKSFNHREHAGSRRNAYVACDEQDLGPWSLRGVWWFCGNQKPHQGPSTEHVFALRKDAPLGMTVMFDGSEAAVCRVNFMVKLLRAHGGCLGRSRR